MKNRTSGILLHITSLPSPFGIGDLGPWAYRFADFLSETAQSLWQILPLNPVDAVSGSPYHASSAFAGNPLLISPERLVEEGYLATADLEEIPVFPDDRVDFCAVCQYKERIFDKAFRRFESEKEKSAYQGFCRENAAWLDDFVLFQALKQCHCGCSWRQWPAEIRDRNPAALKAAAEELRVPMERARFLQYVFYGQWDALKRYCNRKNIRIFGDIPIYVHYESADVWGRPELFRLDRDKRPLAVAGVPPDYFSETGQLWGNPVYDWDALKERSYDWWVDRMGCNLSLFDLVRIDHFRGFIGYWEVPAEEKTAVNGRWVKAPAIDFFSHLTLRFSCLPVVAEDLGTITEDVREVMRMFGFPGMKILLFAFGQDLAENPYAPHNLVEECVVYTGTHDNNTVRGWFLKEASLEDRRRMFRYLGRSVSEHEVSWEMIRLAMMSVARTAVFPMQDILGLGEEARMNRPAVGEGNWGWRLRQDQLTPALAGMLREMTELYGRA
jgi:4-alpha-glucanotransferase